MHIVFQEPDVQALSRSFELDESLRREIKEIKDDYSVGPLSIHFNEEGAEVRREWWKKVLSEGDFDGLVEKGIVKDEQAVADIKSYLNENEEGNVWIWVAPNNHDLMGYYWLIPQLKEYAGRVLVLHLNNLPFINEKGAVFYPETLHDIPPREFVKAQKLARPVTPSEFELDVDEWQKIAGSDKMVRVLEGAKKLSLHPLDYYDKYLMNYITAEWQKAARVITNFLSKSPKKTGDAFMLWRLKRLIESEQAEARGIIKGMKDFEVKTGSGAEMAAS